MISIDSNTKAITYNPEFYLMKHLSAYVKPGSVKLAASGHDNHTIAFYNESENNIVLLTYNDKDSMQALNVTLGEEVITASVDAKSFNTLIVQI